MGLIITRNWLSDHQACSPEILSEVFGSNTVEINVKNMKHWFDSYLSEDCQQAFLAEFIVVLLGFREKDRRVNFENPICVNLMPDNSTLAWSIAVPFIERLRQFDKNHQNFWNNYPCPHKIVDVIETLICDSRSVATKMICQLSNIICRKTGTKDIHEAHSKLVSVPWNRHLSYYLAA